MEKTWKPMVAGILDIVAGALSAVIWLLLFVGILLFAFTTGVSSLNIPVEIPPLLGTLGILVLTIPILILVILAIVGGVYALKRKTWGLALAGSIAAIFISCPLGIAAIVFTILSKNEFE